MRRELVIELLELVGEANGAGRGRLDSDDPKEEEGERLAYATRLLELLLQLGVRGPMPCPHYVKTTPADGWRLCSLSLAHHGQHL